MAQPDDTVMGEEVLRPYTVTVDRSKCRSYENCVAAAPEYFEMDGLGIAVVLPEPDSGYDPALLRKAARLCPVRAIQVHEHDGPAEGAQGT